MWFCRIFLAVQTESLTHWLGHFLFWKIRYETTNKWPIKRHFKFKKMANTKTNTKPWQKYGLRFLKGSENGRRWAPQNVLMSSCHIPRLALSILSSKFFPKDVCAALQVSGTQTIFQTHEVFLPDLIRALPASWGAFLCVFHQPARKHFHHFMSGVGTWPEREWCSVVVKRYLTQQQQ